MNLRYVCCRVEFGTIMLWYYVADRTTVFPQGIKVMSEDSLACAFWTLRSSN